MKLSLQFFGGRGSRSNSGGGDGGLNPNDIKSTTSLVSERERQQSEVDQTLAVFKDVNEEYGYIIGDIRLAVIEGKGASTMAYYDGENIGWNTAYFDDNIIRQVYAHSVETGFHPSNGNKTAIEAVTAHELGHALTDEAIKKMGMGGIGSGAYGAEKICEEARKLTSHRGVVQMASKISGYATSSNREAIAEAYSDVYCNGAKATEESRAIVSVLNKYLKS